MKIAILFISLFVLNLANAQTVEPIKIEQLREMMSTDGGKITIINFWASWCGPCVKELPYFDALASNDQLNVKLVSLDFIQDINKANSVLQKKGINSSAYLLDEKDYMDDIDANWSGAIPATLILDSNGKRYFYEQAFSQPELQELVRNIISK